MTLEEVGDIIGVPGQPSCVKPNGLDRLSQNPLAAWQRVLGEKLLDLSNKMSEYEVEENPSPSIDYLKRLTETSTAASSVRKFSLVDFTKRERRKPEAYLK